MQYAGKEERVIEGKGAAYRKVERRLKRTKKNPSNLEVLVHSDGVRKDRTKKYFDPKDAKSIVIAALKDGCDMTTAAGVARISVRTLKRWCEEDSDFKIECAYAIEYAVHDIVQMVKSEPGTAWKLLKNIARGRYKDEAESDGAKANFNITFQIPRPEHKMPIIEAKVEEVKQIEEKNE